VGEATRVNQLGCERRDLADGLVRSMVDQLTYGRFHADPHPGNVLLLDDGSLGLIDFGMTGHLDNTQRAALFQMTMATATGDAASLRDAIEQVAVVGSTVPDAAFERALGRLLATQLRAGRPVSATAMNDLIALLTAFDIYLPGDLTLCMRTLALLDGTVRAIDPDYTLVDGLLRIIDVSPIGLLKSTGMPLREQINEELVRQLPRMQRIPSQIERITALMARGELRARVSMFSTPDDSRVITTLVNRLVFALAGGTIVVGSAVLLTVGDTEGGADSLPEVFGYIGLAIGTIFILRVIAAVVRDGYE
jgi:ubiquinone biosynthesis protein